MKKIIIASMVGTLFERYITNEFDSLEFKELQSFLSEFLNNENNKFILIVKCRADIEVGDDVYIEHFQHLSSKLNEKQKRNLIFYISDFNNEKEGPKQITNLDNSTMILNYFKGNKEKNISSILKDEKDEVHILAIGSQAEDLDFLIKVKRLNGISYLVNHYEIMANNHTQAELVEEIATEYLMRQAINFIKQFKCTTYDFFNDPKYSEYSNPINQKYMLFREHLLTLSKGDLNRILGFQESTNSYCLYKEYGEDGFNDEKEIINPIDFQKEIEKQLILINRAQVFEKLRKFI